MEQMLFIGTKIDKNSAIGIAEFVERVFKSGFENRMEQNTIIEALKLFQKSCSISPQVNVSGCDFINEKSDKSNEE